MAETTTLEPVETSAAPTTTTSDAVATPPSAAPDSGVQETAPVVEEREGGAQEPQAFDAAKATPAEAYQAWHDGKLKQADFEPAAWTEISDKVGRHQQSINDQQARIAEVRRANAERLDKLDKLYPTKSGDLLNEVDSLLDEALAENRRPTRRELQAIIDNHLHLDPKGSLKAQAEEAALMPLVNVQGGALVQALTQAAGPQSYDAAVQYVSELAPGNYIQAAIDLGRRLGPQGDYITKADAAKAEKEAIATALRKERGENPERTQQRTTSNGNAGGRSDRAILADPTTPVATLMEIRKRQQAS